jgi:vacuolar-type H+-ATPase subunit H
MEDREILKAMQEKAERVHQEILEELMKEGKSKEEMENILTNFGV